MNSNTIRLTERYDYFIEDGMPYIYDKRTDILFPLTKKRHDRMEFHNFLRKSVTFVLYYKKDTNMLDLSQLYTETMEPVLRKA